MRKKIDFNKYDIKGADYHYRQINKSNFKSYNAYTDAKYKIEILLIKKIIKKLKNKTLPIKVLDLGCGDGVIFYLLQKKIKNNNLKLYGIDLSEKAIEIAIKKNPFGNFKVADVYKIPYEENYFDLVLSSDVIEHILEPKKMLSEIRRVGKNNSFTIIGTPIKYTEEPIDLMHVYEYFPAEFEKLLKDFFKIINIVESNPLTYMFLYEKTKIIFNKFILSPYRDLINFSSIVLRKNPFLKIKSTDNHVFSYMYCIGNVIK